MKKKCLFLLVAFAAASANVRAQKTVTDYDGLKAAVDKVNSIPELQKTVDDKKTAVANADAAVKKCREDSIKWEEKIRTDKYTGQYDETSSPQAELLVSFVQNVMAQGAGEVVNLTTAQLQEMKVYYRISSAFGAYSLYVTTADVYEKTPTLSWITANAWVENPETYNYQIKDTNGIPVKKVSLYVTYLKDGNTPTHVKVSEIESSVGLYFVEIVGKFEDCAKLIPRVKEPMVHPNYDDWLKELQAAKDDLGYKDETTGEWIVGRLSKLLEDAQKELKTAETAVTEAEKYKTLTVEGNADIEVSETLGIWPADGEIMGNYNRVITPANTPLFSRNDGTILNLIAQDGRIATTNGNGAVVKDCIVKVSSSEYRVYDDNGVYKPYSTLVDAVYSMRDYFGYDVMRKVATGKVDAKTKLYQANYANANQKDVYSFKVNLKVQKDEDGEPIYKDGEPVFESGKDVFIYNTDDAPNYMKSGFTLDNSVIYLDNTDVPEAVKTMPNVVVRNTNGKYVCSKMTLIEGMNGDNKTQEFYIPYDFSTENLNYERDIKTNTVAVCLPFTLTDDIRTQLASNAVGVGTNEAWFYTFKEIRGTSMYFNISESIDANKPCIIAFKEGVTPGKIFDGLSVDFKSTSGAVLASKSTNEDVTRFFGNYKAGQYAGDLASMYSDLYTGSAVYGFQGGELIKMNDKMVDGQRVGSKLHQFRSYVRHKEDLTAGTTPKSFRVCLLDENGNEVTGIGSVESDKGASRFKAVGGNGVIEISADKACEVKVYTASGALTKTLRVEAGNTTLPLSAGIYIVNQTKVVVK